MLTRVHLLDVAQFCYNRTGSPTDVMNYLRGMNGKIENIVTEMQSIRTTVTTQGGPRLDNLEVLQGLSSPTPAAF